MPAPIEIFDERAWKTLVRDGTPPTVPVAVRKQFITEVKVADEGDLALEFVISTMSVDRDGDTIDPAGWELEHYLKNPVVLWAHNYWQPPVARAVATWTEDGHLRSRAQFTPQDLSAFGFMVYRMYRERFLNAVSVGFLPKEWTFNEERSGWAPMDFKRQELLEYSCVPVPSNPDALVDAKAKGIDTAPLLEWATMVMDLTALEPRQVARQLAEGVVKTLKTTTTILVPGRKGEADAPNYRPAEDDTQRCGTCQHYAEGRCALHDFEADADSTCDDWAGAEDDEEEEEEARETPPTLTASVEVAFVTVDELTAALDKRLDQVVRALEVKLALPPTDADTKAGRVLSAANERRLRDARQLLDEVLDAVGTEDDDEDDEEADSAKSHADGEAWELADDEDDTIVVDAAGDLARSIRDLLQVELAATRQALTGRLD